MFKTFEYFIKTYLISFNFPGNNFYKFCFFLIFIFGNFFFLLNLLTFL